MVVDTVTEHVRPLAERLLQANFRTGPAPMLESMDRSTFEMLRRLSRAGVVRLEPDEPISQRIEFVRNLAHGRISGHPEERGTFYPNTCLTIIIEK
jgi:hypothetical protein